MFAFGFLGPPSPSSLLIFFFFFPPLLALSEFVFWEGFFFFFALINHSLPPPLPPPSCACPSHLFHPPCRGFLYELKERKMKTLFFFFFGTHSMYYLLFINVRWGILLSKNVLPQCTNNLISFFFLLFSFFFFLLFFALEKGFKLYLL